MVEQLEKLQGQSVNPSNVPVCNALKSAEDRANLFVQTPVSVCMEIPIKTPQRRITPIPIAVPNNPLPKSIRKFDEGVGERIWAAQEAGTAKDTGVSGVCGADQAEDENVGNVSTTTTTSSANRPTIGQTSISTTEQAQIREEVRNELRKMFPGIRHSALQQPGTLEQKFPEIGRAHV